MYQLRISSSVLQAIIAVLFTAIYRSCPGESVKRNAGIYRDGDLILGGLIPVHFTKNSAQHPGAANCGGALHPRGYMGVEAMLYAVELINNNSEILPNVSLGVDIKDSCGSVDYAIMECLNFDFIKTIFSVERSVKKQQCATHQVKDPIHGSVNSSTEQVSEDSSAGGSGHSECCVKKSRKTRHTVAIVGAAFSGVTMAIASLAGLFYIPVVSFASTSRLLGDRARFRYFYRTVPSDNLQAKAMVDIIHTFQWSFVITVASDNEYGRSGISALKEMAQRDERSHVCIVVDELFSRKGNKEDIEEIFNKIKQFPMAKVIVVYAEFPDAKYFLEEAKKAGLRDYVFIASDSWAGSVDVVRGMDDVISSVICLRPPIVQAPAFRERLQNKLASNTSEHYWTTQYKRYKEKLCRSGSLCKTSIHNEGYIPYIMDAVFVVADALHRLLKCSKDECKETFSQSLLRQLPAFIQDTAIEGISNKVVRFDANGGAIGLYDLYSLKTEGGRYEYKKFGNWTSLWRLRVDKGLVHWNNRFNIQPPSTCSHECQKGEYKIPMVRFPECCWTCERCSGKSITNSTHMRNCIECPIGTWPNLNKSDCFPIEAKYLQWSDWWAIFILTISGLGTLAVLFTVTMFVKYHRTAVVRAASLQLCFVLLFGISLFFVTPVVFVMKPSKVSCTMLPFVIGLCFSIVVGTILIKTNRISRIFNEKLLQTGRIACLGNQWQIFLMGCLVIVEIVVCLCWIRGSSASPYPEAIYSETSEEATLTCNLSASKIGFSVWLIYNAGLVIICTYQAFLVRKVPQNYNESKFIAFTMLTICITVLVYIPSYLGTSAWYRTVISCFMFVFLGTVTWISIFIPKLHIILFRPHKNIPMRPSVSSITLGYFVASPSVVSNYSDCAMRSGTFSGANDGSVFKFDSSMYSGAGKEGCNGSLPYKEKERNRKTSQVQFRDPYEDNVESCQCRHDSKTENGNSDSVKSCQECPPRQIVKKQSVVRFQEDGEVTTSLRDGTSQKKTSILRNSEAGILRNKYCVDNDVSKSEDDGFTHRTDDDVSLNNYPVHNEATATDDFSDSSKIARVCSPVWKKNDAVLLTRKRANEPVENVMKNATNKHWESCNGSLAPNGETLECEKTVSKRNSLSPNSDRRRKISVVDRPFVT